MRPELKALYTPDIVRQALAVFGVSDGRMLSDWHAETHAGIRDGQNCVVRLSHAAHRPLAQIEGELDWTRELAASGIAAPLPLLSVHGRFAEMLPNEGGPFTAVTFSCLHGREIGAKDWGPNLFEKWGELVGRLHRLSISQRPRHARPAWHESDFLAIDKYIPDSESAIKARARSLIAELRKRDTRSEYFGLIHADVYQDNLRLLDGGGLELFDFDNCEYGWLVSDVANALYAALWREQDERKHRDFANRFIDSFLRGYEREHHLPESELRRLDDWLLLRDVLIYVVSCKQLDPNQLTPWQEKVMAERRSRIAIGTPVVSTGI